MLNNIKLGVKRGQRGHSIPYHHQQSPPTPPHGGPFWVRFQFSNLDNIDSMITFSKSMFPYSMLVTFPLAISHNLPNKESFKS